MLGLNPWMATCSSAHPCCRGRKGEGKSLLFVLFCCFGSFLFFCGDGHCLPAPVGLNQVPSVQVCISRGQKGTKGSLAGIMCLITPPSLFQEGVVTKLPGAVLC